MKIHQCAHCWKHAGMVKSSNTYSSLVAGDELGINAVTIFSPRSLFAQFLLCLEWQFSPRCFQITRENVQAIPHRYPILVFDYKCEVAASSTPLCFLIIRVWLGCKCMRTFEDRMQMFDRWGGGVVLLTKHQSCMQCVFWHSVWATVSNSVETKLQKCSQRDEENRKTKSE